MNFIKDVYRFIQYLTFIDIIFFVSIITLLILLVILVYFIKINKDPVDIPKQDLNNHNNNDDKNGKDLKEIVNELDLREPHEILDDDEEVELLDLQSLTKKLQEQKENNNCISFTAYEKDQEDKAIISYDELLKKQNRYSINYEKEIKDDDLVIKKVNLNDLVNKNEIDEVKEVRVISYEKEEAFLNALKELNRLLN